MESIKEINFEQFNEKPKSLRSFYLKEIYNVYTSQPEINRKENRKRYRYWMHKNYPQDCKKTGFDINKYNSHKEEFKKAKLPKEEKYVSYIPEDRFWYFFSHIKTEDLSFILSRAKDDKARGFNVSKNLLGSVKSKGI